MYEDHYQMRAKAFPGQPAPSVFYESEIHRGALRFLVSGIHDREYFLLVTGEYGMGKTLLYMQLTRQLDAKGQALVRLPYPATYPTILRRLKNIYFPGDYDSSPKNDAEDEHQQEERLLTSLQENGQNLQPCVIVLDEAQDMQISTLNKLRILSNFNLDGTYLFQIVLFAHPSIGRLLKDPVLAPLNQRIRRRFALKPLSLAEAREYIFYRLLKVGAPGVPIFGDDAIELIHQKSRGVPRCINNICDGCLLLGAANDLDLIDSKIAGEAIYALGIDDSLTSPVSGTAPSRTVDNLPQTVARANDYQRCQASESTPQKVTPHEAPLFIGHPNEEWSEPPGQRGTAQSRTKTAMKYIGIPALLLAGFLLAFWLGVYAVPLLENLFSRDGLVFT